MISNRWDISRRMLMGGLAAVGNALPGLNQGKVPRLGGSIRRLLKDL